MDQAALAVIPSDQLDRAKKIADLTIVTSDQEKDAVDGLAFVQGVLRGLERSRKELVSPLVERKKQIDIGFAQLSRPFEEAEVKVKGALLSWRQQEARRIQAEQERIARENAERERRAREEQERLRREAEDRTKAEALEAGFQPEEAQELAKLEAADVPTTAPLQEVAPTLPPVTVKSTVGQVTLRTIPDRDAIQKSVNAGERSIPGVRIYPVWTFEIYDSAAVPAEYRKDSLAGGKVR